MKFLKFYYNYNLALAVFVHSCAAFHIIRDYENLDSPNYMYDKNHSWINSPLFDLNPNVSNSNSMTEGLSSSKIKKWQIGKVSRKQYELINMIWRKKHMFGDEINHFHSNNTTTPLVTKDTFMPFTAIPQTVLVNVESQSKSPPTTSTISYIEFYYFDGNAAPVAVPRKQRVPNKENVFEMSVSPGFPLFDIKRPLYQRVGALKLSALNNNKKPPDQDFIDVTNKFSGTISTETVTETRMKLNDTRLLQNLVNNYSMNNTAEHKRISELTRAPTDRIQFFEIYDRNTYKPRLIENHDSDFGNAIKQSYLKTRNAQTRVDDYFVTDDEILVKSKKQITPTVILEKHLPVTNEILLPNNMHNVLFTDTEKHIPVDMEKEYDSVEDTKTYLPISQQKLFPDISTLTELKNVKRPTLTTVTYSTEKKVNGKQENNYMMSDIVYPIVSNDKLITSVYNDNLDDFKLLFDESSQDKPPEKPIPDVMVVDNVMYPMLSENKSLSNKRPLLTHQIDSIPTVSKDTSIAGVDKTKLNFGKIISDKLAHYMHMDDSKKFSDIQYKSDLYRTYSYSINSPSWSPRPTLYHDIADIHMISNDKSIADVYKNKDTFKEIMSDRMAREYRNIADDDKKLAETVKKIFSSMKSIEKTVLDLNKIVQVNETVQPEKLKYLNLNKNTTFQSNASRKIVRRMSKGNGNFNNSQSGDSPVYSTDKSSKVLSVNYEDNNKSSTQFPLSKTLLGTDELKYFTDATTLIWDDYEDNNESNDFLKPQLWNQYPFIAAYIYERYQVHCDAAAVNTVWLLASASCLSRHRSEGISADLQRSAFVTYCGDKWWNHQRTVYVKTIKLHPKYRFNDVLKKHLYNIGLISVTSGMDSSCPGWAPVTIMSYRFVSDDFGSDAVAVGWGLDRYDTKFRLGDLPKRSLGTYHSFVYSNSCPGSSHYRSIEAANNRAAKNIYCLILPPYEDEDSDPVHGGMLIAGGKLVGLYLEEERSTSGEQSALYTGIWRLVPWIYDEVRIPDVMDFFF